MHVLIPHALADDAAARAQLPALKLPQLQALLQSLSAQAPLTLPDDSPVSAHEYLLAQARGLDPQAPAWAALRAHELGLNGAATHTWAWLTPCQWEIGTAQVILRDPAMLALDEGEARALRLAMAPYFAEDGLSLHDDQPLRWLVHGEALRGLVGAAPERVIGRDVAPWLPASPLLRRLQNEMQMLLYTHPICEARAQRGALAVNSFWLHGAGALPAVPAATAAPQVLDALTQPALHGDWPAWARAWQTLDAQLADLMQAHASGQAITLTLCGELTACSYRPAARGLMTRLRARLKPARLSEILATT